MGSICNSLIMDLLEKKREQAKNTIIELYIIDLLNDKAEDFVKKAKKEYPTTNISREDVYTYFNKLFKKLN